MFPRSTAVTPLFIYFIANNEGNLRPSSPLPGNSSSSWDLPRSESTSQPQRYFQKCAIFAPESPRLCRYSMSKLRTRSLGRSQRHQTRLPQCSSNQNHNSFPPLCPLSSMGMPLRHLGPDSLLHLLLQGRQQRQGSQHRSRDPGRRCPD